MNYYSNRKQYENLEMGEVWGNGCLPVVYRRPWNKDLLPEDWPLYFSSAGEGVEMVIEAMTHYEQYAAVLHEWLQYRFAKPCNFPELIAEVWRDYTLRLGDKIRLIDNERGGRRSL